MVKQYAAHLALDRVSIQAPEGQIFGLLGPNGAGKTTLIRIINRIMAPDSGIVLFNGRPSMPDDVYRIGYLPEERGLYKKMKIGEQAIYLAQLKGLSYREAKKRLQAWFEKFGIMSWWNKKLEELSKGMQQKIQFIITVVHEPSLLILDEPFSGFDPVNTDMLKQEILKLKEKGHTIIFSTHDMGSVEEICDHIALINHSQVVLRGSVEEVRGQFKPCRYALHVKREPGALPAFESPLFEEEGRKELPGGGLELRIRKREGVANSELLRQLASRLEIVSFREEIPSMHDIFIQVVANHPLTSTVHE